jgi:hypothetical protein
MSRPSRLIIPLAERPNIPKQRRISEKALIDESIVLSNNQGNRYIPV